METLLPSSFFERPVLKVAEELLGKVIIRKKADKKIHGVITDVEAYDGPDDLACHGRFGRTARTAPMFGPAGHWYVYLAYGMHWMLNIVTGPEGYPAAILIRGITKPDLLRTGNSISSIDVDVIGRQRRLNGPGRLTQALRIGRSFNAQCATKNTGLWIEDHGIVVPRSAILRTPRIGVDYARAWAKKPYRFVLAIPITLLFLTACAVPVAPPMTMEISSPAFAHNGFIPAQYTCDGDNRSPPLHISGVPGGAKSLALIHDDPDAPMGTWVHWLLWNIDPRTAEILENSIPPGAIEGITSWGKADYGGPCPPSGTHRYFFKLYALDAMLDLRSSADMAKLEEALKNHILVQAELIGVYNRRP